MSERVHFSDSSNTYTTGRYNLITITDAAAIQSALENTNGYQTYLDQNDPSRLPRAVSGVNLHSYWRSRLDDDDDDNDGQLFIESDIDLDKNIFRSETSTDIVSLLQELQNSCTEYTGASVLELPHEPLGFYLVSDNAVAIHISYRSDLSSSTINIQTEYINDLADYLTENPVAKPLTNEETLRETTVSMTAVLDALHAIYDDNPNALRDHFTYELNSPQIIPKNTRSLRAIGSNILFMSGVSLKRIDGTPDSSEILVTDDEQVTFDTLGGLDAPKRRLLELADAFSGDEIAIRYGQSTQPMLLYGPPGTGKTSLAKALAHHTGAEFVAYRSKDIIDKYIGESPKQINSLFEKVYKLSEDKKVVLFLDEIDAYTSKKMQNSATAYIEVQKELQIQLSEELPNHKNLLVLAATNADIDDIPSALTRSGRFEKLYVGPPNNAERRVIWSSILQTRRNRFAKDWGDKDYDDELSNPICDSQAFDYDRLAQVTDGKTGTDINTIVSRALDICASLHRSTGKTYYVDQEIIEQAIQEISKS